MATKIGFISLGCPKNQLDTEVMLHEVMEAGYEITPEDIDADIIIVNTCAFIESAKRESIENILDVAWLKKNRNLKGIIVTGCLAERYREQVIEEMPEVDAVLGVGGIHHIVEAVRAVEAQNKHTNQNPDPLSKYCSFEDKDTVELGGERVLTTPEYASYLKIGEGCNHRCSYCAIPFIRGRFRSRPMDDLVEEAKQLGDLGVKELTLIAQDTTGYGKDLYGHYALAELIHRITEETDIPWIRILYCYPDKITDELIEEFRTNPRLLKYIDIPLQHISDHVLKAMRRHGDGAMIRDVIQKLRTVPGMVIRTTFIVGFPGETEEDFNELCDFVKEARFDHMGAFTYSREEGTPAYDFPDQIDEQVKQDRMDILMREQMAIDTERNEGKVGSVINVLCEDYDPVNECYYGRSEADAPEIDGKVFFRYNGEGRIAPGSMVKVKVREVVDYDLYGFAMQERDAEPASADGEENK